MKKTLGALIVALGLGCSSPPLQKPIHFQQTIVQHVFDTGWQQVLQGNIEQALLTFSQGSATETKCRTAHEFLTQHKTHFQKVMQNYKYCKDFIEASQDAQKIKDLTSASLFEEIRAFLILYDIFAQEYEDEYRQVFSRQALSRAATLARDNQEYSRAQALYEKAQVYGSASYCAARVGNIQSALELSERAQLFVQATEYALGLQDLPHAVKNYKQVLIEYAAIIAKNPEFDEGNNGVLREREQLGITMQQHNILLSTCFAPEINRIINLKLFNFKNSKIRQDRVSLSFWIAIAQVPHLELIMHEYTHEHDTAVSIAEKLQDDQCAFDNHVCGCGFIPSQEGLIKYGTILAQKAEKEERWHTAIDIYKKLGGAVHTRYYVPATAICLQIGDVSSARELLKKQPLPLYFLPEFKRTGINAASVFAEQGDFTKAAEIYEFLEEKEKAEKVKQYNTFK